MANQVKIPLVKKVKIPLIKKVQPHATEIKSSVFQWPSTILGQYGSEYAEIDRYILDTLDQRTFSPETPLKSFVAYGDIEDKAKEIIISARDIAEAFVKVAKMGEKLFDCLLIDYFTALDQSFQEWENEDLTFRPTLEQLLKVVENAPSLDMDTYLVDKAELDDESK